MIKFYRTYVMPPGSFAFEPELEWFLVDLPVIPLLLTAHATFASLNIYRLTRGRQFWLKSLVLTIFAAFGGSTLANVLSGRPAPLFTHSSNYMLSYVTATWYMVNHFSIVRALLSFRPFAAILSFMAMAAKARAIFNFIDEHNRHFPGAAAGAIVLGGLSGSGGSFFVTLERIVQQGFAAGGELSAPGWGFKSAYIAASLYYIMTDPHTVLRSNINSLSFAVHPRSARFWISLFLCSHAAFETLIGRHINPFYAFEQIFFALSRVRKESQPVAVDIQEPGEQWKRSEEVARAWAAYPSDTRGGVRRRRSARYAE
ncbi:TRIC channel [Gracilaria domingensis]|nr:TRIC channel [Gracilaria domingensis]